MRKIIGMENFGFNGYRGNWNAAIILEIPLEEQDEILETLQSKLQQKVMLAELLANQIARFQNA